MRGMYIAAAACTVALPAAGWAAPPAKPAAIAAAAKPGAAKPAAPAASTVPPGAAPITIKRVPMSQEGNAIVARINASPDTRLPQIQAELRAIRAQFLQFISGTTVDVDKLEAALRRELALTSEARTRDNERLLMVLRALSESDRVAYLQQRSIQIAKPAGAAAPAKSAAPASAPPKGN